MSSSFSAEKGKQECTEDTDTTSTALGTTSHKKFLLECVHSTASYTPSRISFQVNKCRKLRS